MSGLIQLIAVANEIEAEIVHQLLESHGIHSVIKASPGLNFPTSPILRVIYVQEEDFERAREILNAESAVPDIETSP